MTHRPLIQSALKRQILNRPTVVCWLVVSLGAGLLIGCGGGSDRALDDALVLYRQNRLEEALPHFLQAAAAHPDDPDALAWMAETFRRLELKDSAVVFAERAIAIDTCNSFAQTVLGEALNPMYGPWEGADEELAWAHLLKAVACNPDDGNTWRTIWPEAIRRGNTELQERALNMFIETGYMTPAILAYNRWMLADLPENAILLTNGDMDTYPAVALQQVEGFRRDVAVVNYSLLNTPWYARFVRDAYGVPLPVDDAGLDTLKHLRHESGHIITVAHQIVRGWLDEREPGTSHRPLAVSITVGDRSFAAGIQERLIWAGAFHLWEAEPTVTGCCDTTMMRTALERAAHNDYSGPFVSPTDRSAVLIAGTHQVVTGITHLAVQYADLLIAAGRTDEALQMLNWAETFETNTEAGPVFTDRIRELREAAAPTEG
ncbi:MAG TPA: hypothetical protein VM118_07235 [Acidobacteriota bacterium]|nr:hypothetical protein [Acidobacteriota bacterium]